MRKILLCLSLLFFSISIFSQDKDVSDIKDIRFYGVDYSKVKIYGADESDSQFRDAFESINNLLVREGKKYNVGKFLKKNVVSVDIAPVIKNIQEMNVAETRISVPEENKLSKSDVEDVLKSLDIKASEEPGLIFITELIDKNANKASYKMVFFDTNTREIIESWDTSGKGRGFGTRNYWAHSLLQAMKSVKLK